MDFLGGYIILCGRVPQCNSGTARRSKLVLNFKEAMTEAGPWVRIHDMQGETIPKETNHVRLSKDQKDQWGIPQLGNFC